MNDLLPVRIDPAHAGPPPPALLGHFDLVAAFLAARKPSTVRAYARDLADFAAFVGRPSAGIAVEYLVGLPAGEAHALALGYKAHMIDRRLAPATINRRLAALRSLTKLARTLGRSAWTLATEGLRSEKYRDTRGPGLDGWRRLWAEAEAAGDGPKARRDRAILRLLYDRGLRRGELVGLDLADLELGADPPAVTILGKGRAERERLTINAPTARALAAWVEARGSKPGPAFVPLDPGAGLGRLTGEAVRRVVRGLGRRAGLARPARPHGLRHAAVTRALDLGRDIRDVAQFSRHKDIRTLLIYDDRRQDVGGDIARALGDD